AKDLFTSAVPSDPKRFLRAERETAPKVAGASPGARQWHDWHGGRALQNRRAKLASAPQAGLVPSQQQRVPLGAAPAEWTGLPHPSVVPQRVRWQAPKRGRLLARAETNRTEIPVRVSLPTRVDCRIRVG